MLRVVVVAGWVARLAAAQDMSLPPMPTPPAVPTWPPTLPTLPPTLPPPTLPTLPPIGLPANQAASAAGQLTPAPLVAGAPTGAPAVEVEKTATNAFDQAKHTAEGVAEGTKKAAQKAGDLVQGGAETAMNGAAQIVGDTRDEQEMEADGGSTREELRDKSQLDHVMGTFLYPAVKLAVSMKTFIIPILALALGGGMMIAGVSDTVSMVGKLILYFGAQSFMNIFMSWVLHLKVTIYAGTEIERPVISNSETTMETFMLDKDLAGCPAGFALTAMQQVISFILFVIFFIGMGAIGKPYQPKPLTSAFEWVSVVIFGCVFAANIALNNFSLAYISIGVNLIIRSCLPLTTYISQQALANFGLYKPKQCSPMHALEVLLMAFGVTCAAIFVWASFEGKLLAQDEGGAGMSSRLIGVLGCIASLLCGSVNLALAGVLGETKLNVLDTVAYMAIPATLFLTPIIFGIAKPIPAAWAPLAGTIDGEVRKMTDWEVLSTTFAYSKSTIAWLALSGVFSFMYNLVQFNIVHTLSPSATAFGGNFNKAALTFMTLLLPFLQTHALPKFPYLLIEWVALIINIAAFTGYSILTIMGKQGEAKTHEKLSEDSGSEETESGSGSE